jgi:hypothetical protein
VSRGGTIRIIQVLVRDTHGLPRLFRFAEQENCS